MPELVNAKLAGEVLGISVRTVRAWAGARRIPSVRVGDLLLFDLDSLRDWIAARTRPALTPRERRRAERSRAGQPRAERGDGGR